MFRRGFLAIAILVLALAAAGSAQVQEQRLLETALGGTSAVAVALDGQTGRLVAAVRAEDAGRMASAPGSTLKPFFLMTALEQRRVRPETTVACGGHLRIGGRSLACTHPHQENVLDAERALAWSCNTWFARLAMRFAPDQAAGVLRTYGFGSRTGRIAGESSGEVRTPQTPAELQLLVLGLHGVEVTPVQMAQAYFQLSRQLDRSPVVRRGLEGSVGYGMAHNAATAGLSIAGKTGTASEAGQAWTHGWFAGIAEQGARRIVVVVYVPRGNGADAAELAHRFFALWRRAQ